jgi:hypothetical protein
MTFCLTAHNRAQTFAIGGESDFVHVAKVHNSVQTGKFLPKYLCNRHEIPIFAPEIQ